MRKNHFSVIFDDFRVFPGFFGHLGPSPPTLTSMPRPNALGGPSRRRGTRDNLPGMSGIDVETTLRKKKIFAILDEFGHFSDFSLPPSSRPTAIIDPHLKMYGGPRPGGRPWRLTRVDRWLCICKESIQSSYILFRAMESM